MSDDPQTGADHPTRSDRFTITTEDGVSLEAEATAPTGSAAIDEKPPNGAVVVCHPHPLYGGNMHANVVDVLNRSLPPSGVGVLRFNFRGAGASTGTHGDGIDERLDVVAAIDAATQRWPDTPILLAGYSFGADVSLTVDHPAVSGWLVVAPPLRIVERDLMVALTDERPKTMVGAAHDQYNPHDQLAASVAEVPNTTVVRADGADHFFAVGLDTVVDAARQALGLEA